MKRKFLIKPLAALMLFVAACKKDSPRELSQTENSQTKNVNSSSAVPFGTLIDGATYRIRGVSSLPNGPVVEVTGASYTEGAEIQQWSWFPNDGQKWELVQSGAYYKVVNIKSGKCIESPSSTSGAILKQSTNDGSDAQLWQINYSSGSENVFTLTNKANGLIMVIDPESSTPGAKIRQKSSVTGTQGLFNFHNLNFQNPLIDVSRADPYVAQKDGYYYFMYTRGGNIGLRKTTSMSLLSLAPESVVWTPPTGTAYSKNIWAPELHFVSGKWYLYFAADDGNDDNHRMYVLENANADPMTGTWTFKGKITDPTDQWAIDGSIVKIGTTNYFVWSGWESIATKYKQHLYIAPMSSPWTLSGSRVKISTPTNTWERHEGNGTLGEGVNEAPIMLQRNSTSPLFVIFSASRYNSENYCLAQIQLKSGGNPLVTADWINKKQVFVKNTATSVYGPGHNGFFTSSYTDANGVFKSENWFVYHARSVTGSTGARTPRMQKLTWNTDGSPNFGTATATGIDIPVPIGE
jgi:GH43 family beta-xylosidase